MADMSQLQRAMESMWMGLILFLRGILLLTPPPPPPPPSLPLQLLLLLPFMFLAPDNIKGRRRRGFAEEVRVGTKKEEKGWGVEDEEVR